jgi:hypothetical protein
MYRNENISFVTFPEHHLMHSDNGRPSDNNMATLTSWVEPEIVELSLRHSASAKGNGADGSVTIGYNAS